MKEQVARILGNMAHEIEQCGYKDPALGLLIKQATQQICQKFPKTAENPDGYELKPDILFCPKMNECSYKHDCSHAKEHLSSEELCRGFAYKMCLCPKPDEGRLLPPKRIQKIMDEAGKRAVEAECREKVERIFREIEGSIWFKQPSWPKESFMEWWQALKEGVK